MEQKTTSSKNTGKKVKQIAFKRTMNFAYHKSNLDLKKVGIVLGIIAIVALLFLKFGILDQMALKTAAYNELSDRQNQLAMLNLQMIKYNELKAEYDRYSDGRMDEDEVATVARTDLLDIVEKVIMPRALVSHIEVSGNRLIVVMHNITLEESSVIVTELEKEPLVDDALVAYATSEVGSDAEIHMTIYLRKVAE